MILLKSILGAGTSGACTGCGFAAGATGASRAITAAAATGAAGCAAAAGLAGAAPKSILGEGMIGAWGFATAGAGAVAMTTGAGLAGSAAITTGAGLVASFAASGREAAGAAYPIGIGRRVVSGTTGLGRTSPNVIPEACLSFATGAAALMES